MLRSPFEGCGARGESSNRIPLIWCWAIEYLVSDGFSLPFKWESILALSLDGSWEGNVQHSRLGMVNA